MIRIVDGPIRDAWPTSSRLPTGEIGELIVTGPVVTREYVTRREWNALAKIADGPDVWHRMGDAGYFDDRERFWFCGRVAHRVLTADGPMYHHSLRRDLQRASGGLSFGAGRHRAGRPAAAGDRGGMLARTAAALAGGPADAVGRIARLWPGRIR